MFRRIVASWVCLAIVFSSVLIIIEIAPTVSADWIYVDDSGGADYTTIQEAIDAASDGDTVYVYSGTYYENVEIDITLNITGEDMNTTFIDGGGEVFAVRITADWVNITGFTMNNSDSGIRIESNNNFIQNNNISHNEYGLFLETSALNTISRNKVRDNNLQGIYITVSSNDNLIRDNFISNNSHGIDIESSNNNIISDNFVSLNDNYGITLSTSTNNNISNNNASANGMHGIYFAFSSSNNYLINNTINANDFSGIQIQSSNNNYILENVISLNDNGLQLNSFSSDNQIYHNNIIDNTDQAFDDGINQWDDGYPSGGNYWSDWTTPDDYSGPDQDEPGSDGIVDEPKVLASPTGRDNYPFTTQNGWIPLSPVYNIDKDTYYDTIQDAINDADPTNTIIVSNGTYNESVVIDKDINLIGESSLATFINGMSADSVILISSISAYITGFTVTNGSTGIDLPNSNAIIESMIIDLEGYYGINVGSGGNSPNPIIRNNTILNCSNTCIDVDYEASGVIENNMIYVALFGSGIRVRNSNPLIIHNTIETVGGNSQGIVLDSGADVDIVENIIYCTESFGPYACAVESQSGVGRIYNCSFDFPETLHEFVLGYGAILTLFNSTYDSIYYYFEDSDSVVISKWWVDLYVNDTSGNPEEGAEVWIENVTGGLEYHGFSDSSGRCLMVPLTERVELVDANITHTPHTFIANNGSGNVSVQSIIDRNKAVEIVLDIVGSVYNVNKNTYHDTIQEAIDNATAGDTIEAGTRTYYENLVVDKTLTLIGEDRENTVINGSGSQDVVFITADWVNITGFTITGSGSNSEDAGIELNYVQNCNINNNNVTYNFQGIYINRSNENIISSNNASYNGLGIYFNSSVENSVMNNIMIGNGIFISGDSIEHWNSHNIDASNTVNGKPVYYWKDQTGGTIPGGAGQVILANCNNVIIENQELSNGSVGIELGFSSNNEIRGNTISSNIIYGLFIISSSGNTITSNTVTNNGMGILLGDSDENNLYGNYARENGISIIVMNSGGNIIEANNLSSNQHGIWLLSSNEQNIIGNSIFSNDGYGIWLLSSESNNISENNISNNDYGVYLWINCSWNNITYNTISDNDNGIILSGLFVLQPLDNLIYHNSIIDNTNQAADSSENGNQWDNGYLFGGNYWKDYTGVDENSGPNQDQPGCDGIGDYAYTIDSDSQDDYPLMEWPKREYEPPVITLISPNNNSVIKPGIIINLSISDPNINEVFYSISGGTDETLTPPYEIDTSGWEDDNYILEIRAKDTHNNVNIKWYNFTIDSTPPSITLNSPYNNSYIIWYVEINLTISDDNLNQVSYIKDDDSVLYLSFPYNIDTDSWEDGRHVIEVTAEDLAGNLRKEQFAFTKDTTPPVITLNSPENNTFITEDVEIYFTITDENLDEVYYRINNDTYLVLPFPYRIYTKGWQDGRYVIDIIAVDFASIGDIDQYVFTKDTVWPEIILNSPENNTLLMQASTLDFDISDRNLDSVIYSINQDTFQTLEEPYDLDTSDWDDNEYIVTIRAEDDAGHINEKWFIFRIDTSEPSIESASINDGATKVSIDVQIVIEFSESMECESVESAISINPYIEYTCIWSNDNKTLAINFSESLEYDTIYQITINTNAEDMAGRELEDKFELEFTTEPKPTDKGEEGLPLMYLLLSLIAVIIAVLLIMFMVLSKKRKSTAEVVEPEIESPVPIQVTCPTCNNLLQVNDIGTTMNVSCPFCSTLLTVQSQKTPVQKPEPQIQPQPETQPEIQSQQPMMQISCPICYHRFSVVKTDGPIKVQCPNCGVKGTMG